MLEDLIQNPGEMKHLPPPPKGGIPKQRIPWIIRKLFQIIGLPYVWLDHAAHKVAIFLMRPPYKQVGKCKQRGNCCYFIQLRKCSKYLDLIQKFWATEIHGFYLRSSKTVQIDDKDYYILGCRYMKKNGKCGNYFFRPLICRLWPVIEHFGYPRVLKGCGYSVAPRKKKKNKNSLHIIQ